MKEGGGEERKPPTNPLPALLLAPFFARSLTFVPRSLLRNCTETLATQANYAGKPARMVSSQIKTEGLCSCLAT